MSYSTERRAIEAYFTANWVGAIGYDAHAFTPTAGSVLLTINSGAALQGSVGRLANRIDHIGTLTVSIFTYGGQGSEAWRQIADTAFGLLFETRLDDDGAVSATTADTFIRFSPPQLAPREHPYIAASFPAPPFHQTNLIAPFVRYEYR